MRLIVVRFSAALLLFAYACNTQAAPSTGLLDDGGFNNPTANNDVSNSDWTLTTNMPDGSELGAQFHNGGFTRSDGAGGSGYGIRLRAFEGNQDPGDAAAQATLTQSISAPISGDYNLDFDWYREDNFSAGSWDVSLSSSGTGGTDSIDMLTVVGNPGNFNQLLVNFGVTNTASLGLSGVTAGDTLTVTMSMVDGVDAGVNPQGGGVDNFVLTVPEPTSALLCLMGLASLAAIRRRS